MTVQGALFEHSERRDLGAGAWVDLRSSWMDDANTIFDGLLTAVPWRA